MFPSFSVLNPRRQSETSPGRGVGERWVLGPLSSKAPLFQLGSCEDSRRQGMCVCLQDAPQTCLVIASLHSGTPPLSLWGPWGMLRQVSCHGKSVGFFSSLEKVAAGKMLPSGQQPKTVPNLWTSFHLCLLQGKFLSVQMRAGLSPSLRHPRSPSRPSHICCLAGCTSTPRRFVDSIC